jgi:hypothetical protein
METPINHFFNERSDPRTLEAFTRGPLAAHLSAYAQELFEQGYTVSSGRSQLRMLGHFNRWLQSKGLAAETIDSSTIERYVRCRRKSGKLHKGDGATLVRMWRMLRPGQARMPSSPPSACEMILRQFQHYLRQERGLAEATHVSCRVFSDRRSRLPSTPCQRHCRLRPTTGEAHHHQTRKKRGERVALLSAALTLSRRDRHGLSRLRSHYCYLVAIDRAEVPSRRADPTCIALLRSGYRDWEARLRHTAFVGASRASRR